MEAHTPTLSLWEADTPISIIREMSIIRGTKCSIPKARAKVHMGQGDQSGKVPGKLHMAHLLQGKADTARVENHTPREKEASPLFSLGIVKGVENLVILEPDARSKVRASKGTAMDAGTVATP